MAPSREVPLAFTAGCLLDTSSSESISRGEAKRCVSMRAEKRLRVPEGGLESLSVKEDSEQEKRFLEKQDIAKNNVSPLLRTLPKGGDLNELPLNTGETFK